MIVRGLKLLLLKIHEAKGLHKVLSLILLIIAVQACTAKQLVSKQAISAQGMWIEEADGSTMLNPQTSGLSYDRGILYTVSDGSAHASQIQYLHQLDIHTGKIIGRLGPITLAPELADSCFVSYLTSKPDYEAIVALPNQTDAWLLVTEDATRAGEYSQRCKLKFANTGSTEHPTLLVKVELLQNKLVLSGVRALQFSPSDNIGNFPNDGVEGLAITRDMRILLGIEKDANTHARVFEAQLNDTLFDTVDSFLAVSDSELWLPDMGPGNHPINGMDIYYPNNNSTGFLIAAARNDDQLWIIDLAKKQAPKIIDMLFYSPCDASTSSPNAYLLSNTSIEGVAVHENTLYLINDPWKRVYKDNARENICPSDTLKYERMSPLLFKIDIPSCFADASLTEGVQEVDTCSSIN